jgi:hypothetical protein
VRENLVPVVRVWERGSSRRQLITTGEKTMPFIKQAQTYFAALYPSDGGHRINLYCEEGYRLYIMFPKGALSASSYNAASKTGVTYVELSQYPDYIDLVRNEKPVSVTFNPDVNPPTFVVHVSETVGEGEI